ncbi:16018_t:CDS:2, partial [Dentiscutata erythropus]
CGEKGHYSRDCLAERETPVPHGEKPTQPNRTAKRETETHYGGVNDVYNEREIYTIDDRYFTEEMLSEKEDSELYINSWQDAQSPAAYLSHVEELPTASLDEEKSIEEKIEKMEVSEELDDEQQKEAKDLIKKEKGIFVRNVEELGPHSLQPPQDLLANSKKKEGSSVARDSKTRIGADIIFNPPASS